MPTLPQKAPAQYSSFRAQSASNPANTPQPAFPQASAHNYKLHTPLSLPLCPPDRHPANLSPAAHVMHSNTCRVLWGVSAFYIYNIYIFIYIIIYYIILTILLDRADMVRQLRRRRVSLHLTGTMLSVIVILETARSPHGQRLPAYHCNYTPLCLPHARSTPASSQPASWRKGVCMCNCNPRNRAQPAFPHASPYHCKLHAFWFGDLFCVRGGYLRNFPTHLGFPALCLPTGRKKDGG